MELITVLLPIILEVIKSCNKNDGEAKVRERLQRGGPGVRLAVLILLRQRGLRGTELRQSVDEVLQALKEEGAIDALMAAAKEE